MRWETAKQTTKVATGGLAYSYTASSAAHRNRALPCALAHQYRVLSSANAHQGRALPSAAAHSKPQENHANNLPLPSHTMFSFLHDCTQKKDLTHTRRLHFFIVNNGLQSISFWADHLIRLLTLFGSLQESIQVFHRVLHPTVYTWHAIMQAHIKFGECEQALDLYRLMLHVAIMPDRVTFLCVLQACSSVGLITFGMMIHDQIIRSSLEPDIIVANTLIDLYGKCACVDEAHRVFDKLPNKTVVSWGAMIGGYAKNGYSDRAFELVKQMQQKKVKFNNITLSCILKACDTAASLERGKCIHILAILCGLESDILVARALIDMYVSCNSLQDARSVFDQMKHIDMKSWGIMTAGYSQCGLGAAAFQLFEKMQQKGLKPDRVIYLCMSQACQSTGSSREGKLIHAQIIKEGLETHITVGNTLIDMHVMCGNIDDARNVFDRMETKDVVSWVALISGYVQHDHNRAALRLFSCMQQKCIEPDKITFLWILKSCGKSGSLVQGRSLHDEILKKGFESDVLICGSLIDMYGGCGSLDEALLVFNKLPSGNIVSWGAMTSGYVQHGHDLLALELFEKMRQQDLKPDEPLYVCLLKTCSRVGAIDEGRILHNHLEDYGIELNTSVTNALIEMYSKCGLISEACIIFDSLPLKNVSCCGSMISAYVESSCMHPAFSLFEKMHQENLQPDKTIYLDICKACASIRAIGYGNLVYDTLIKAGFKSCLVVGSALIDMYARCSRLKEAENVFCKLPNPDAVCWGALLAGYAQNGHALCVLEVFNRMQETGVEADRGLFLSALKACSTAGRLEQGRLLHQQIVDGNLEKDVLVVSALIDMYGKCGNLEEAHSLLENLQCSNEVSCGAMISGYVQHEHGLAALELFETMQEEGVKSGKATFLCTLKACSNIGAIKQGRCIHDQVVRNELEADLAVGNTIIDLYAKCGSPEEAHKVFEGLTDRDVVSWSVTITAYASRGNWEAAFELLKSMQNNGMQPDDSLFISLLSACSQNGLLKEGCQHFSQMKRQYRVDPRIDHFNCVVDILGRGGNLSEAEDLLKTMPVAPDLVGWVSLLTGCRVYGNKGLGKECLDEGKQIDLSDAPSCVLLSKIYADSDQFPVVDGLFDHSMHREAVWSEVDTHVHENFAGNFSQQSGESLKRTRWSLGGEGFISSLDLVGNFSEQSGEKKLKGTRWSLGGEGFISSLEEQLLHVG